MAEEPNTDDAPLIPYGRADFRGIRLDGSLYVDKTGFIRTLERHRYVLFIRPRRFGKTCWLRTLERLFVTGVSPLAMDDVTSGFNIGRNLSLNPELNAMLGFTEEEVRGVLNIYHRAGEIGEHPDDALATMRWWYNGYRFAEEADEDVYNTDMVLYYIAESQGRAGPPLELIDDNVRLDYGKLRHLLTAGGRLNGNFHLLREAMTDGRAECRVRRSFPQRELDERDNFLSLLHYFGLLSICPHAPDAPDPPGEPELVVPNQTAHHLLHAFLRDAYRDVGAFSVYLNDLERLMRRMAQHGEWRPAVDYLADAIQAQSSVRDYLREEKMVQGFLAAYLGATDHFLFSTAEREGAPLACKEREFSKGYVDFCLEPFVARHPRARHGYLIELKYLKREDDAAKLDAALTEAAAQLKRYLADDYLQRQGPDIAYTGLAIAFHGWELARCEAVGDFG